MIYQFCLLSRHHILIEYDRIKVEEHFSHAAKEKLETKIRMC